MEASSRNGPRRDHPVALLTAFAAATAVGDAPRAARALTAARRAGVPRVAAEETALMLMLHAGYPAALEGTRVLHQVWPGRARRTREGSVAQWRRRGGKLCARVYGTSYAKLRRNVRSLHPDLATWMIEQGYGRVLARPGLDGATRELVAVAVLAAGGWERQLTSHLIGAGRLGATRAEGRRAFAAGVARASAAGRRAGRRAWRTAFGAGETAG